MVTVSFLRTASVFGAQHIAYTPRWQAVKVGVTPSVVCSIHHTAPTPGNPDTGDFLIEPARCWWLFHKTQTADSR